MKTERSNFNPVLRPEMCPRIGTNLNGPSVIRVPDWVREPLGKFYLYFAHHCGRYIRMAYSDDLMGPWSIHTQGVLDVTQTPFAHEDLNLEKVCTHPNFNPDNAPYLYAHIASPDVHVDFEAQKIRMYYHGMNDCATQATRLTASNDGLSFEGHTAALGASYFRVFQYQDWFYAISWGGILLRSQSWEGPFEQGPKLIVGEKLGGVGQIVRHVAITLENDRAVLYYTCIGANPEAIFSAHISLAPNWKDWQISGPRLVLTATAPWEGGGLPKQVSCVGSADAPVHGLRDPYVFEDHIFYSGAGEQAIGVARLGSDLINQSIVARS